MRSGFSEVKRKVGVLLAEIQEAIEGIQRHTSGKSLADFERDWLLRLAVKRALAIVSEASRHIPDEMLAHAPDVPWKKIRGIGNVLRHEYHKIADDVVWAAIADNLAPLAEAIATLRRHADVANN